MTTMRFADLPGVFAGIVAIAIVGSALVKPMEILRARLLVWHQKARSAESLTPDCQNVTLDHRC